MRAPVLPSEEWLTGPANELPRGHPSPYSTSPHTDLPSIRVLGHGADAEQRRGDSRHGGHQADPSGGQVLHGVTSSPWSVVGVGDHQTTIPEIVKIESWSSIPLEWHRPHRGWSPQRSSSSCNPGPGLRPDGAGQPADQTSKRSSARHWLLRHRRLRRTR